MDVQEKVACAMRRRIGVDNLEERLQNTQPWIIDWSMGPRPAGFQEAIQIAPLFQEPFSYADFGT